MERKLPSSRIVLHNISDDEFDSLFQPVAALHIRLFIIPFSNYSQMVIQLGWIG